MDQFDREPTVEELQATIFEGANSINQGTPAEIDGRLSTVKEKYEINRILGTDHIIMHGEIRAESDTPEDTTRWFVKISEKETMVGFYLDYVNLGGWKIRTEHHEDFEQKPFVFTCFGRPKISEIDSLQKTLEIVDMIKFALDDSAD